MVCDGWSDTLSWSIHGETQEYSIEVGLGPASTKNHGTDETISKGRGKEVPCAHSTRFVKCNSKRTRNRPITVLGSF